MKTKGRRQSSNVQDQRGPTAAYNRPSALKTAADKRKNQAFWDGKLATASKSKMAKDAGLDNIGRAEKRKLDSLVDQVIKESTKTQKKIKRK